MRTLWLNTVPRLSFDPDPETPDDDDDRGGGGALHRCASGNNNDSDSDEDGGRCSGGGEGRHGRDASGAPHRSAALDAEDSSYCTSLTSTAEEEKVEVDHFSEDNARALSLYSLTHSLTLSLSLVLTHSL